MAVITSGPCASAAALLIRVSGIIAYSFALKVLAGDGGLLWVFFTVPPHIRCH